MSTNYVARGMKLRKLTRASDILVLKPKRNELLMGSNYASFTLPWTFNRMMQNTGSSGQNSRGLNIAKGIVGQEMLRRALKDIGISNEAEAKSHRDDDFFDFKIKVGENHHHFDVKTFHHYTDYGAEGIETFSPQLVIKNAAYNGPDWRRFFPMLIPHTQILQNKENYVFAIACSIDPRKDILTNRRDLRITAFPYAEHLAFFSSRKLCILRENAKKGIYLKIEYKRSGLFDKGEYELLIIGEWDGKVKLITARLDEPELNKQIGPFSCIDSIQINPQEYENLEGQINISISKNKFTHPVLNSTKININIPPKPPMIFTRDNFCNLILPTDYKLFFLGWIPKNEYLTKCRKYSGWVWPSDKVDRFSNQIWFKITERDFRTLNSAGFSDCIQKKPSMINAGWMKTSGMGTGACCYLFPNIGYRGGVKETNLFILPKDLYVMSDLKSFLE